MKTRKISKTLICMLLLLATIMNFSSCSKTNEDEGYESESIDLMRDITPNNVEPLPELADGNISTVDFAVRLFRETAADSNTLISPLSVMYALAMTVNGADEATLSEMESVLGMSVDELNEYLYTYTNSLPIGEKYKLSIANSIWVNDDMRFTANNDFLQRVADYYRADIYKSPFNYNTLRDINNWVKNETGGTIPKVLEEMSPDAVMYLINALYFEAEWSKIYQDYQVRDGKFTTEKNEVQKVEMMYSTEYSYLEDANATGFLKYYKGGKYAFLALLPNEGMSIESYIDSLDGENLYSLLSNVIRCEVRTSIPKFESEFAIEFSEILSNMGMPTAFDPYNANFTKMGESITKQLYISRVIHKTFIQVAEKGTKAGAVTVVEVGDNASAAPTEPKRVYLDRPFVYMIIDTQNNVPIFIGSMTDIR